MTLIGPTILPPALVSGMQRASQLLHHYAPVPSDPLLTPRSRGVLYSPSGLRASSAWGIGSDGRSYRLPEDLARHEWWDLDGDGVRETPALVCEDASTNLAGFDTALASWSTSGTITRSYFASLGDVDVYLVTDSDATNRAYLFRTISASAFVGATAKGIRIIWGRGPTPAASGAFVWLRDTSGAPADRCLCAITAAGDGSPIVTPTPGTTVGVQFLRTEQGVRLYAIDVASTAVTVASPHEIRIGAATTATQTGTAYLGAVLVERDDPRPSSRIATPGAGSVTRAREVLGWLAPYPPVGAQAWLLDLVEAGATGIPNSVVAVLTDANGANPSLAVTCNASGRYTVTHHNGTTSVSASAGATPAWGSAVRLVVLLHPDGSVQIGQGVNGGAITYSAASAALAFGAQWGADPASTGYWLQPLATFGKARTRLVLWKANGAVVSDARLAQLW